MLRLLIAAFAFLLLAMGGAYWILVPPSPRVAPRAALQLDAVTLVQPGAWRLEHARLRIADGRITSIATPGDGLLGGSAGPVGPVDSDEWRGSFVVPGLVDLHVHYAPRFVPGGSDLFGALFLRHGVTTVRDVGSFGGDALTTAARVAAGRAVGPRILSCGPFLEGASSSWPGAWHVSSPIDAASVAARLRERGASCMKLYNGLSPEHASALIAAAKNEGLKAVAHVSSHASIDAYRGAEVQHLIEVVADWPSLSERDIERAVESSRSLQLDHTPTLVAFAMHASELLPAGRAAPSAAPAAARWLPGYLRDLLWKRRHNPMIDFLLDDRREHAVALVAGMGRLLLALRAGDVPVFLGSDTPSPGVVPGASLQMEMELWARLGIPFEDVWQIATREAGSKLAVPQLGAIEVGAPADLLLFSTDPTTSPEAFASLQAVIAGGRLYRVEALDASLDAMQRHFERASYDRVTRGITRALLAAPGALVPAGR